MSAGILTVATLIGVPMLFGYVVAYALDEIARRQR